MTRAIWFSIKLALLLAVGFLLIEVFPGTAEVTWFGYEITMHVGVLLAAVVVFAGLAALLYNFWRFVRRTPAATADAFAASRKRRGFEALTRGMVAIAAGDPDEAERLAKKAEGLLKEPPLTMLLSAQAAQLQGDDDAARRYFEKMLENDETRFLGLRGLLRQALRREDTPAALEYTRQAHSLRPDSPWVLTSLVDLNARSRNYAEAENALELAIKHKAIEPEVAARQRAVVKLEIGRTALEAGDSKAALKGAKAAASLAPDLIAAHALVAEAYDVQGKAPRAARHLEKNWHLAPHRDLAALYLKVRDTNQPLARFKALKRLVMTKPEAAESNLVLARAALAAGLWGEVRHFLSERIGGPVPDSALAPAPGSLPDEEVCRLLAQLAEGEVGDMAQARAWLARSVEAPPAPTWLCSECGAMAARWQAHCEACDAFDMLAWQAPHRAQPMIAGATYLPLQDMADKAAKAAGALPALADAGSRRKPPAEAEAEAPAVLEMAVCAPDDGVLEETSKPAPKDLVEAQAKEAEKETVAPAAEPEKDVKAEAPEAAEKTDTAESGVQEKAEEAEKAEPAEGSKEKAASGDGDKPPGSPAVSPAAGAATPAAAAKTPELAKAPLKLDKTAAELAEAELIEDRARRFSEEGAAGN